MLRLPLPSAAYTRGVFTRAEALAAGWTPRSIHTRLRGGDWLLISPGRYVDATTWAAADPVARYRFRALAYALDRRRVLCGPSAAAVHGFAILLPPGSKIYAHWRRDLPTTQIVEHNGVLLTSPARTVLDCARFLGAEAGVVVADHALHTGAVRIPDLEELLRACPRWPGRRAAEEMCAEADGRAESPLESLSRFRLVRLGVPRPELQVEIRVNGLLYRLDFWWRAFRTAGEADGMSKYTDVATLRREKRRQLTIEDFEAEIVRWSWGEIWRTPPVVATRVFRAFDRAMKRFSL